MIIYDTTKIKRHKVRKLQKSQLDSSTTNCQLIVNRRNVTFRLSDDVL